MLSLRDPARFFPCSGVSINECSGYAQRTIMAGSETFPENIYTDEASCEMTFRKLVNDVETNIAHVVADQPGYLARSMTINPAGKRVDEHIYASERKARSSII